MDFGTALSSLIKPQCQFPDPAAILALANLKYPLNYGLPNYGHSLLQTRQQGGMPPIDIASLIAAATSQEPDSKLVASLASAFRAPTPATSAPSSLPQLPCPIPAQPSSPSQSSASVSSLSSSSLSQSTQNSPVPGRTTTPTMAGFKRKLNGTPTRKPPAPIPEEKKDEAYFERRRKNNDAAKRSRDARRMKEEQTAAKASFLEQENLQLRTQIEMLKTELANVQMLLLSTTASNFPTVKEEANDDSRPDSATFGGAKAVTA